MIALLVAIAIWLAAQPFAGILIGRAISRHRRD